jgi:sensor histidine kinase regulating citrate/malate metabolism
MMARFADASIRLKLIFAMALVTVLALLVSAVALGAYEVVTFRRALEQKLTIIADIVGRNCQVALAFDRSKDAGELLAALEAKPAVGSRQSTIEMGRCSRPITPRGIPG